MLTIDISDSDSSGDEEVEEEEEEEEEDVPPPCEAGEVTLTKHNMGIQRGASTEKFQSAVTRVKLGIKVVKRMQFHTTRTVARAVDVQTSQSKRKKPPRIDLGYFPRVLRMICKAIRKTEQCYLVVELLPPSTNLVQYLVMLRHTNAEGIKEDMMLAAEADITPLMEVEKLRFCVGFPIKSHINVVLDGDGSFIISDCTTALVMKPSNVQSQWAAVQFLNESLQNALDNNHFEYSKSHSWCSHYLGQLSGQNQNVLHQNWNFKMTQREVVRRRSILEIFHKKGGSRVRELSASKSCPHQPDKLKVLASLDELQKLVLSRLRDIMYSIDMDNASCISIRKQIEEEIGMNLVHMKGFIEEKILLTFGQMDEPSLIKDYLYLGSEWNACNYDELKDNGITHILNVSTEIESPYELCFVYHRIDVLDVVDANLLKHWECSHKFIKNCRDSGGKVLVHCQMGVSRSGSTTISYLMREYGTPLHDALTEVKNKRHCVKPNTGFMKQLECYERTISERLEPDIITETLNAIDILQL